MGNARWDAAAYAGYSATASTKSRAEVFTRTAADGIDAALDPAKIKFRESVDSAANPLSTPIILAADVTGSMGEMAEIIVKTGLGLIMGSIYTHKPVTDPHICCMAIGDAYMDRAPLQVTEFEAEVGALTTQVEKLWLEGGGGGNAGESYSLVWWFAAFKVLSDAAKKRGRKGYLFTIGDEAPLDRITSDQVKRFLGVGAQTDVMTADLLKIVQEHWHVFHLIVKPVVMQPVKVEWRKLLNERAIMVLNHEKLAEMIATIITTTEGADVDAVVSDFDADTAKDAREVQKLLTA